jgi:hypothetical protein
MARRARTTCPGIPLKGVVEKIKDYVAITADAIYTAVQSQGASRTTSTTLSVIWPRNGYGAMFTREPLTAVGAC